MEKYAFVMDGKKVLLIGRVAGETPKAVYLDESDTLRRVEHSKCRVFDSFEEMEAALALHDPGVIPGKSK